jgi:hypothetical protein
MSDFECQKNQKKTNANPKKQKNSGGSNPKKPKKPQKYSKNQKLKHKETMPIDHIPKT